jgi:hypothetical protein
MKKRFISSSRMAISCDRSAAVLFVGSPCRQLSRESEDMREPADNESPILCH